MSRVLRDFLPEVFPGKYERGREFEMEWTGIMGYSRDNMPWVGAVPGQKGVWLAGGYSGESSWLLSRMVLTLAPF